MEEGRQKIFECLELLSICWMQVSLKFRYLVLEFIVEGDVILFEFNKFICTMNWDYVRVNLTWFALHWVKSRLQVGFRCGITMRNGHWLLTPLVTSFKQSLRRSINGYGQNFPSFVTRAFIIAQTRLDYVKNFFTMITTFIKSNINLPRISV